MPANSKQNAPNLITSDDVVHISELCRLKIMDDEIKLFTKQFNDILGFFKTLVDLDTSKVEPMFHVIDVMNIFRKDEVRPSLSEDAIFLNIPKREGRFIKAPRMI